MSDSAWHFTFLGYPAGFGRPELLWVCAAMAALGLVAVLLALRHENRLAGWVAPKLVARLAPGRSRWRPVAKAALSGAGLSLLALALARPQLGGKEELLHRRGIDVVVALDASRSMLARDVAPDRMARAKLELETLLDQLKGDRVGLVTFAGSAFVQMPMTSDYAAARLFLRAVDPSQMPQGGTDIGGALRLAKQVLDDAEHGAKERVVVLLTDGEDMRGDAVAAARALKEAGVKVYAVGIGSETGEPIPELDAHGNMRGYHKDSAGNTVLTKLDREALAAITGEGGGELFHQPRGIAMGEVARRIDAMQKSELEDRRVMTYTERYQWLLAPGLALLLAGAMLRPSRAPKPSAPPPAPKRHRAFRSAAGGVAAAALLGLAGEARAGVLDQREELTEQGRRAYDAGRYDEALKAFDTAAKKLPPSAALELNRGSALYKLGRIDEAKQAFLNAAKGAPGELEALDRYNLGNALAQLGQKKDAIAAYRRALALNPADERARHNLEVLLRQDGQDKSDSKQQQAQKQQGQGGQQDKSQQGQGQQLAQQQGQDEQKAQSQQAQGEQKAQPQQAQGEQKAQSQQAQGEQKTQSQQAQGEQETQSQQAQGEQKAQSQQAQGEQNAQAQQGQEQQQDKSQQGQGQQQVAQGEQPERDRKEGEAGTAAEATHPEQPREGQALARAGSEKPATPSPGTARILDSMRTNERSLQLWRFQQQQSRRNDDLDKDW